MARRIVVAFFVCSVLAGAAVATSIAIGVPDSGIELGLGWDTQRSRVISNRCIEFAPVREEGQQISLKISDIADSSELMEELNVSASMSVRSMMGSGSAQAEFATRSKVSRSTNTLLIRATVNNGVLFAGPSRPQEPSRHAFPAAGAPAEIDRAKWDSASDRLHLTEFATDLIGDGGARELREFERYCGDSFVSAIFSGAELLATMSISTTGTESVSSVKAKVKGEFSAWGAKVKAESEAGAGTDKKYENSNIEVDYTQIGGSGGIIPTTREDFKDKLHNLPTEALNGPNFHTMNVTPYSDLPDWPRAVVLDTEEHPIEALLVDYYWTLSSIEDLLEEGNDTGAHADRLKTLQDTITGFRREVFEVLGRAFRDAGQATHRTYFFGLISLPNHEVIAKLEALENDMQELRDRLVRFSFGHENPNLIKLYLHAPAEAETDEQKLAAIKDLIGTQARRTCDTDPVSPECLTDLEMESLESCLADSPKWQPPENGCPRHGPESARSLR